MKCFYYSDIVGYGSSNIKERVIRKKHPTGMSLTARLGDDIERNITTSNYSFNINLLLISDNSYLVCLTFDKSFKLMNEELKAIEFNKEDSDNVREYIILTGNNAGLNITIEESERLVNSLTDKINRKDHSKPLFKYGYDNINLVKSLNKGIKCLGGQ